MNKRRTTILIHLASWAALFILPIMLNRHSGGIDMRHLLMSVGVISAFITVYYANFLWITPRHYTRGGAAYFLLYNAAVIIVTAIGVHYWIDMCDTLYPDTPHPHDKHQLLPFVLRDIFNLSIVAAVATAMQLASRWRQTEEARREAEAARTEAELKTLRNQINPHFLLNTLNNIYALTAFDTEKAQEAIQQLSKMLRHLLYDYEQPTVPLKDEVEFLENYINLMKIRLPQTVEVSAQFEIPQAPSQVAPMIFISLVENAFKHGISPTEPSFIHISLKAGNDDIVCEISNSNHPKSEADRSGHGIGLQQVQRRLELAYQGRYTWERGASEDGKVYHSRIKITLAPQLSPLTPHPSPLTPKL